MSIEIVDLSVVIVTFNSREVIGECLKSIGDSAREIIVVDNASTDDTQDVVADFLQQHPENRIRCVQNSENIGYGRAANQGLQEAQTRYALLINPDIRIVGDQLQELRNHAHLAPVVAPDVITDSGRSEQKLSTDSDGTLPDYCEGPWVVGAAMLFDRETAPRFDENIFLFFEETDLCRRVDKIVVLPAIRVTHQSGHSSGNSLPVEYLKGWHCAWSRHYFRRKHDINHSVTIYLATKCLQWCCSVGNRQKQTKYGSRIAGTVAWLRGQSAFEFTAPPQSDRKAA